MTFDIFLDYEARLYRVSIVRISQTAAAYVSWFSIQSPLLGHIEACTE